MVKNESKYLERCLQSLQPLREAIESELIIVDTGSTDKTVEIAKKFTEKVYFHPWNNNFSEMRNITISYATGEWFLVIDGDEILNDATPIIAFLKAPNNIEFGAAGMHTKNFTDENDWNKFSLTQSMRLFKMNNEFHYSGAIHNQPVFTGTTCLISAVVLHYGYIATDKDLMERKFERTATILKRELEKEPTNIYYLYQLSVSYGMHKDFELALDTIKKAYALLQQESIDIQKSYLYVYHQYIIALSKLKKFSEIEAIANNALKHTDELMDVHCLLGEAYMQLKDNMKAIASFEKYLDLAENYGVREHNLAIVDYTLSHKESIYYNLCLLYHGVGNLFESFKYATKIKEKSLLKEVFPKILSLVYDLKKPELLYQYYTKQLCLLEKSIVYGFEEILEQAHGDERNSFAKKVRMHFSKGKNLYSIWNQWKIGKLKANQVERVCRENSFQSIPDFYLNFIVELFRNNSVVSLSLVMGNVSEKRWNQIIAFVRENASVQFLEWLYEIVSSSEVKEFGQHGCIYYKLIRSLARVIMLTHKEERKEIPVAIIEKYLDHGMFYIQKIYSEQIVQEVLTSVLIADPEDLFLLRLKQVEQLYFSGNEIAGKLEFDKLKDQYNKAEDIISYWKETRCLKSFQRVSEG